MVYTLCSCQFMGLDFRMREIENIDSFYYFKQKYSEMAAKHVRFKHNSCTVFKGSNISQTKYWFIKTQANKK